MNKKGLYCIAIVVALIFGYRMYENRITINLYWQGMSCFENNRYLCSEDLLHVRKYSSGDDGIMIRGVHDKLLSKYTVNNYIILSDDGEIYVYDYVDKTKTVLPDELQKLGEDTFKTAMVVVRKKYLMGIIIDIDGTGHYSYYSLKDSAFTYLDKSVDGVISYDVNPLVYINEEFLIINVTDYENDEEYTLLFNTFGYHFSSYKLDFKYDGDQVRLISKLSVGDASEVTFEYWE